MDLTTILLIDFTGGLAAMALAYGICITVEKTIALSKRALPSLNRIHWTHSHQS